MPSRRTYTHLFLIIAIVATAILAILNSRSRLADQAKRFEVADDYTIHVLVNTKKLLASESNSLQAHTKDQTPFPKDPATPRSTMIPQPVFNASFMKQFDNVQTNQSLAELTRKVKPGIKSSLLRAWSSAIFENHLRSVLPQWKSCVLLCSKKRLVEFTLPKEYNCSSDFYCEFTRFRTHESQLIKFDHRRRIQCNPEDLHKAVCPTFYSSDCSSFSWIQRKVRLSLLSKRIYTRYMDITPHPGHSFRIHSLLPSHFQNHTLVVSFYLPSILYYSKCNRIYCVYSNTGSKQFEIYPAVIGDVSFAYCPNPSNSISQSPHSFLQIAYHPDLMSLPHSFKTVNHISARNLKQVNLSVCAIVRKEGPYLIEWIEFHRMMGVSRIILYDNNPLKTPDILMEKIISVYGSTLVRIHWPASHSQTEAYTDCINRFGPTTKWMALIDVDEFIVPQPGYKDIIKLLVEEYRAKPSIHMKWLTFGPCGKKPKLEYQLTMEVCRTWTKSSSDYPKSLFMPKFVAGMQNFGPHYVRLRSDIGVREFSKNTETNKLRLYHYRYRTYTDFIGRRLGPRAGRALHWDIDKLEHEWEKGVNNSHVLKKNRNWIYRFRDALRHRLVLSTRKVGGVVLSSNNTTTRPE